MILTEELILKNNCTANENKLFEFQLLPTEEEIKKQLIETKLHVLDVEYVIFNLGLDNLIKDPQRPHDISGSGSKFSWDVIKGMALEYREEKVDFNKYIKPSIDYHRQNQYHHIIFNEKNSEVNFTKQMGELDLYVGAIDVICSLSENRKCYGGKHTFNEIRYLIKDNPFVKATLCLEMLIQIEDLGLPETCIENPTEMPKIALPSNIKDNIHYKTIEAIDWLSTYQGYDRKKLI